MGFWNSLTSIGHKAYDTAKNAIADVYAPVKKVVNKAANGIKWVDSHIDNLTKFGLPQSMIDVAKDNPIWSTITGGAQIAQDLVNKDLPSLGRAIEGTVGAVLGASSPGQALDTGIKKSQHIQDTIHPIRSQLEKIPRIIPERFNIPVSVAA